MWLFERGRHLTLAAFAILVVESVGAQTNSWEHADGPYGGSIYGFGVSQSGIVFAGTAGGGLFRSSDSCKTWESVNIGVPVNNVRAITTAPNGDIYVSTENVFGTSLTLAVHKSTNEGTTWSWVSNGLLGADFNSMAANSAGYIFVGSDGYGVFRTTNSGANWARVHGDPNAPEAHVSSIAVNKTGHIFASSWSGVARSTDNGDTWTQLNMGIQSPYVRSLSIGPNGHIFGAAWDFGVVRSTNNGSSWSLVFSGVNVHTVFAASNGSIFFGAESNAGGTIRRSTDNGANWTIVLPLPPSSQFMVRAFSSSPSGATLVSFSEDGIRLTTDNGETWHRENTGLRALSVNDLRLHQSGYLIAGTHGAGIFRSPNGIDWRQSPQGPTDPYVESIAIQSNGTIFAGTLSGRVFKSTDYGESWNMVGENLGRAIAVDETDGIFAGVYGQIYRSTDSGLSWSKKDSGTIYSYVQSIAVSPNGHVL